MLGPTEEALASPERALCGAELERVHRNELRLLELVNTLLDFSRLEAGRARAHYQPIDLSAFTVHLASAFQSLVEKAGLTLTVDCPPTRLLNDIAPQPEPRRVWKPYIHVSQGLGDVPRGRQRSRIDAQRACSTERGTYGLRADGSEHPPMIAGPRMQRQRGSIDPARASRDA